MLQEATEITIRIKNDEKTLKKKFLVYDSYNLNSEDPIIKQHLNETIKDFGNSENKDITITAKLEV